MSYHIFIERAKDPSPPAAADVAAAIAKRFGLPAPAIAKRLAGGRFRVKSNVEQDTAERFAAELERLGAVVSVVDADSGQTLSRGAPAAASAPSPAPVPSPAPAPASSSQLSSGLAAAGSAASSPSDAAGSPDGYESGLAAALGSGGAQKNMSDAFSGDSASFSLADVTGEADEAPAVAPVSGGGGGGGSPKPKPAAAASEDMFRPPDEGDPLDVALDLAGPSPGPASSPASSGGEELLNLFPEPDSSAGSPMPTPVGQAPLGQDSAMLNTVASAPSASSEPLGNPVERVRTLLARNFGMRVAAGALLIMLLGFLPAHVVGMIRGGAYDTPREKLEQAHEIYSGTAVATADELTEIDVTLDQERATQLTIMSDTQSSIAITAGVVWLLCSGGLGFVWFRKLDWDQWA